MLVDLFYLLVQSVLDPNLMKLKIVGELIQLNKFMGKILLFPLIGQHLILEWL